MAYYNNNIIMNSNNFVFSFVNFVELYRISISLYQIIKKRLTMQNLILEWETNSITIY